jgi:hypothetical protein
LDLRVATSGVPLCSNQGMSNIRRLIAATLALLATFALAAVAAGTSSAATAASSVTSATPPSVTLTACTNGTTIAQRTASFSAEMQAFTGTSTMSVNFRLFERTAATHRYVEVNAPGFGVWQVSNRGIAVFTANENVIDLPAPASFRAVVHYRWMDRHHHVIRTDTLVSPACVLQLLEPDLSIVKITHAAGATRATSLYGVVVHNGGLAAAGPFAVALSVGQTVLAPQTVTALAPSANQVVQFSGPRCIAGTTVTAQVDPAGSIVEPANADRKLTLTCGASG